MQEGVDRRPDGLPACKDGESARASCTEAVPPVQVGVGRRSEMDGGSKAAGGGDVNGGQSEVKGGEGYVWVFTNLEEVVFMYKPTREGSFLHELLREFKGGAKIELSRRQAQEFRERMSL